MIEEGLLCSATRTQGGLGVTVEEEGYGCISGWIVSPTSYNQVHYLLLQSCTLASIRGDFKQGKTGLTRFWDQFNAPEFGGKNRQFN